MHPWLRNWEHAHHAAAVQAAAAGRASYVPTSVAGGIPDPGALAVSMLLGAVAGALAS